MADRLEDVVNIGPALAHDLRAIGVEDGDALREVGARDAWLRLYEAGSRDCLSSFLALEGAVRGLRWMQIAPDDRDACCEQMRALLAAAEPPAAAQR
ncbi:TfoX/Sxy family DNA transformation protein [Baekduia alba]|uniref:TfoX/Sxy family DNA transformation protein n=1 Tax=Baekduia alba TaxID=2997333 RepID=UPI00233FDCEA|nr:TfoX/Sxy family DNA transformation protein [Baekduia alba]